MPNPPESEEGPKWYLIVIDAKGTRLLAQVQPDPQDTKVVVVKSFYNGIVWSFRHIAEPAPEELIEMLADQIIGVYDETSGINHLKNRLAHKHRVYSADLKPFTR